MYSIQELVKSHKFLLQELVVKGLEVSLVIDLVTQQTESCELLTASMDTKIRKRMLSWIIVITVIQMSIHFHTGLISAFVSAEASTNKFK